MTLQRRDWLSILAFTVLGAGIRLVGIGGVGLDHFDEGIYAIAGTWSSSPAGLGALDPGVIAYAPPVFPILVGVSYALLGVSDGSAMIVSVLAGIASIPVLGWIARRIYGPGAGASAAGLAACSGPHITFSTMALTDATFLLAWLVALTAGIRWLDRPGFGRAIVLGLAVAVAQGVKYNGWLAGAIVALAAASVRWGGTRPKLGRVVGTITVAALTAGALTLPWFAFVERHGGYPALLTHQRAYLGGFGQWWPHARIQLAQIVALSRGEQASALAVVMGLGGWLAVRGVHRRSAWLMIPALAGVIRPEFAWWLGLTMLRSTLGHPDPARRMIGLAWLVLSILTPFYHPYARLWLPLHASGWLSFAAITAGIETVHPAPGRKSWNGRVVELLMAVCLAFGARIAIVPGPVALIEQPGARRSLRDGLVSQTAIAGATPLRALVRPPVLFYLGLRGIVAERATGVADLAGSPPEAWLLVDGVMLGQEGDVVAGWRKLAEGRVVAAEWDTVLGPATRLDIDPDAVTGRDDSRVVRFTLFRPRRLGEVAGSVRPR